jgi:hypothetical protein
MKTKKYSIEWKLDEGEWYQRHSDGKIYRHYIKNGCEWREKSSYATLKKAHEETGVTI